MLKCRDIVEQADQLLDRQLSWRGRLGIRLHLLMCRHCRRYVALLRKLLSAVPFMHGAADDREVAAVMETVRQRGKS